MKQQQFEEKFSPHWRRYAEKLALLDSNKKTQDASGFVEDYRELCQHLALARDRHYSPNLLRRLNKLALAGQDQLYNRRQLLLHRILNFILFDFPASVQRERIWVAISSLLFFGLWIVTALVVLFKPELVYSLMEPGQVYDLESMYNPDNRAFMEERGVSTDVGMFGFYIWNNIGIAFRMLAAFVLAGFGTIFMLVFQGIYFGAVTGHMINMDFSVTFFSFVSGHSSWELLGIMLAGAVGLKLGWALIMPARRQRLHALQHAASQSIPLIYGLALMLLIAAAIEGFWSSTEALPPLLRYCVGLSGWALLITYFTLAGRVTTWLIPAIIGAAAFSAATYWLYSFPAETWLGWAWPCVLSFLVWVGSLIAFWPAAAGHPSHTEHAEHAEAWQHTDANHRIEDAV